MAETRTQLPVLLVVAAFSAFEDAMAWGEQQLRQRYGPLLLEPFTYDFVQTAYYAESMGANLKKHLLAFERLIDAAVLPDIKRVTNRLEAELAAQASHQVARPINLDPGILTLGKFVLATTKDQGHRIYLRDGIFAEVTLRFEAGSYETWPWTYADYRQASVRDYLRQVRSHYQARLRQLHPS